MRKTKGKVMPAERPSQWKPLDVTKVPRTWIKRDDHTTREPLRTPSVAPKGACAHQAPLGKRELGSPSRLVLSPFTFTLAKEKPQSTKSERREIDSNVMVSMVQNKRVQIEKRADIRGYEEKT